MAPIMPFTSEEIWKHMPKNAESKESVHLVMLPEVNEKWRDEVLSSSWEQILSVRGEVTKALEEARVKKLIGHPLDAEVNIEIKGKIYDLLESYSTELRSIFIVSAVRLFQNGLEGDFFESTTINGMKILVKPASDQKCERCWIYDPSVGESDEHPTVCARCRGALAELDMESK
jgi:isoleucyl-tRNA synthetase